MRTKQQKIISGVSDIIQQQINKQWGEMCYPSNSPDSSDDIIRQTGENIVKLREIRQGLETIFSRC